MNIVDVDRVGSILGLSALDELSEKFSRQPRLPDKQRVIGENGAARPVDVYYYDYRVRINSYDWYYSVNGKVPRRHRNGMPTDVVRVKLGDNYPFNRNGGMTLAVLTDKTTGLFTIGIAVCSMGDKFKRRKGRYLAEKRAAELFLTGLDDPMRGTVESPLLDVLPPKLVTIVEDVFTHWNNKYGAGA